IIARFRRALNSADSVADRGSANRRTVSVILATRDRAEIVCARLDNLLSTQHPAHLVEVIVALDAEHAMCTVGELRSVDARVRVIVGDAPGGKAVALNAGVRAATGEVLVLADAQQRYDVRTIPELVLALENPAFGAVSGALQLGANGQRRSPVDWYWKMEKWLRHNEAQIHSSVGVTGAVYATRRALWPSVPAGTLLDDVYVPMSLVLRGYRVGFTYAAKAFDVRTFDAAGEGLRKTRTLTGVLQLRALLPNLLSLKQNPIALQFIAHKVLRLLTPALGAVFVLASLALLVQLALAASVEQLMYALAAVAVLLVLPFTRRRIVALAGWSFSLQLATMRAIGNGIGGRWSVWGKPRP
ncbi:MAG: glycosyltransferase, partial [Gemmatimonadota bacterium]|nr:glycosyltransferase [Gemmatimonadota bacterium]